MTMTKRERSQCEKAYLEVRPKIFEICSAFQRKHGGNFEDLFSEAHQHFMWVYLTHDPDRGTFEGDVIYRVWIKLFETYERDSNRKRHLNAVPATEGNLTVPPTRYFDMEGFMKGLGADAKQVVRIVFNSPPDVELAVVERGDPTPKNLASAIREYLMDVGWTVKNVRDSFREIRNALKD